jgi:RNA-directed DNA polymerase
MVERRSPGSDRGTPQGGVISPLLANVYLHWFEKVFYAADGPGSWAKAQMVRYADDFMVLARYQGGRLVEFIEEKIDEFVRTNKRDGYGKSSNARLANPEE